MKYYEVSLNCGCCSTTLAFESEERLQEAFKPLGLTVHGKLVDDEGVVHEDIDSFYGFRDVTVERARAARKARKTGDRSKPTKPKGARQRRT